MTEPTYDVIVIGGGPAGSSAAIYTARAKLKTLVIDKSATAGALGITSKIANYPGVRGEVTGADLVRTMQAQAKEFGAEFVEKRVIGVALEDAEKKVFTADGTEYSARALILSTGAMGKTTTVPGEERFLGRGVSYCATCDGAFFEGKEVLVVGSTGEAVHETGFLTRFAKSVVFLSPKVLPATEEKALNELTASGKVRHIPRGSLKEIEGKESVESVTVSTPNGEERITVSGVFLFLQGNKPIVDFLQGSVKTTPSGCMIADGHMATSVPGVFSCGDMLCNEIKQAVVAAAQGVVAALSADRYLRGGKGFARDYA